MIVNTGNKNLIVADELEAGMIIPGKLSGDPYEVVLVHTGADDILGNVVQIWVKAEGEDAQLYTLRPYDKIWVLK